MKHFRPRLSRRAFWVLCALLVCLRLALTGFQQAYIWVGGAPLDDELMFRAANHITAGQWLGAYDYLTLSKAMFFPVWLALLHALHLPYLIGGTALWCGASLLAAFAFSTLWRKKDPAQGRVLTLGLFAALAFLPSSWAAYTLRVYRDNIFPALCLYFFAGMAGMALRPRPAVSCTKILVSKACTRSVSSRAALMYFPGQIVGHGKEPGLWTSMLLSTQLAPVMIRPTPPAARRTK